MILFVLLCLCNNDPQLIPEIMTISGHITKDGTGEFFYVNQLPTVHEHWLKKGLPKSGDFEIKFLGAGNKLLLNIAWDGDFVDHKTRPFTWFLHRPVGVKTVLLTYKGKTIDKIIVSSQNPKISNVQINEENNEVTLKWDVTHTDKNIKKFNHLVYFSRDKGKSWLLFAVTEKPHASVNIDTLETKDRWFQIRTSDGWNVTKMVFFVGN